MASPAIVVLDGDVKSWVDGRRVEVPGRIALDEGWLEVAVCRRGSREHESVVVVDASPSTIHAALLLAGFEPGSPATWNRRTGWNEPTGTPVEVSIQLGENDGRRVVPLADVIQDDRGDHALEWVFAGSLMRTTAGSEDAPRTYMADLGGTVVGLSTFGDEVVAAREVRSPDVAVDPATWRLRAGVLPTADTSVLVVFTATPSDGTGIDRR